VRNAESRSHDNGAEVRVTKLQSSHEEAAGIFGEGLDSTSWVFGTIKLDLGWRTQKKLRMSMKAKIRTARRRNTDF